MIKNEDNKTGLALYCGPKWIDQKRKCGFNHLTNLVYVKPSLSMCANMDLIFHIVPINIISTPAFKSK